MVLQEGETISFLWITAREFLEFVESEKHVWTQRERMEGYLDGVRNEEDNDCDFLYREFDGDNLGRFANLEEVKLYLERTGILD